MFNFFKPKAFNEGYLPQEDGHQIYYREFGNKKGEVVLVSHGGPGSFSRASKASLFNLSKYRVIMFDQRGCGKSLYVDLLKNNTTKHTISDMARLIDHLRIHEKVILSGTSYGSTLSLLFAQKYPHKVRAILINSIFLANKEAIGWGIDGSKMFFPECHEEVVKRGKSFKDFFKLTNSDSLSKQKTAIKYYFGYECLLSSIKPKFFEPDIRFLNGSKISLHYMMNGCFIKENQILKNANTIKDIKTLIVHNRLDMVCPIIGAHQLHKKLENSRFVIVPEFGHGGKLMRKTFKKEIKKFLS